MRWAPFPDVIGAASDDFASSILTCGLAPDNDGESCTRKTALAARVRGELLPASAFKLQGRCCAFTSWRARIRYTQTLALPAHE
jgi:hypothetical protein